MRWLYRFLCMILRCGPLPLHLSVIMDGNRRYASSHHLPSLSGHLLGYSSLLSLLQWSRYLGLQSLTLYAWSIDNYNRSREEVHYLMQLFCDKMHEMSSRGKHMRREGVELRLLGNMCLLPEEVQAVIEEVRERARREREEEEEEGGTGVVGESSVGRSEEEQLAQGRAAEEEWIARQANQLRQRQQRQQQQQQQQQPTDTDDIAHTTAPSSPHPAKHTDTPHTAAHNTSLPSPAVHKQPTAFVNLCVAYTSQQEMTDAAARIARALQQHNLQHTAATLHPLDLSASLFHSCLYTAPLPLPFPSLLLRTSGEHRLSDFLLCQLPTALLCWSDKYWPQLSLFDVLRCVVVWQRWVRQGGGSGGGREEMEEERVVREEWRREWLKERGGECGGPATEAEVEEWIRGSEQRIERFVQSMPSTTVV